MSRARAASAMVVAAVAAAAPHAHAVGLTGSAGVTYERSDTSAGSATFTIPAWSWYGDLALSGLPVRPELLAAMATASYAAHRSVYDEGGTASNDFSYQGSATVLSGWPLNLALSAGRGWGDGSSGRDLAPVGDRLSSSYAGTLAFHLPAYPSLNASLARTTSTTHTLAMPAMTAESTMLHAGGGQSLGPLRYSFSYDTSWNGGNTPQSDYRTHNLGVEADVDVSEHLRFGAADRYYLRLPTNDSPWNPRLDGHDVSTTLALRATERVTASASYRYNHLLAQTSTSLAEIVSNQIGIDTGYRFSPEWSGHAGAAVSDGVTRGSSESRHDLGETLRAGGAWDRAFGDLRLHATAEGNAGRVAGSAADATLAYGVKGAFDASRAVAGAARLTAGYGAGYQHNDVVLAGSSVSQDAHLRAEGTAWGLRLSSVLTGELTRRSDRLLGVSSTRTARSTTTASTRAGAVSLAFGHQEGWADESVPPGLLVPVSLNSRSRYASLTAYARLGAVGLTAEARLSDWIAPDRPREWEARAVFRATHAIGKVQLRLEDQYTVAGTPTAERRGNFIFISAGRRFEIL